MNISDQVKHVISTVAPTLGLALGGPLGGAAGTFLAKALGVPEGDDSALSATLTGASPDTLLALKKADNDFKAHLADIGVQESQLTMADVASARQREMALKDYTPSVLAYILTAGFFGLVFALLQYDVPVENKAVLFQLSGILGTAWIGCVGYYFGSSASSRTKDVMLWHATPPGK